MKKILLYQHGGSGNHGCEALVRTTYALVKEAFPDAEVTLFSFKKADDLKYLSDIPITITGLKSLPATMSFYNIWYHIKKRLRLSASKIPITNELKKLVKESDAVIAIGGDNYCYAKGEGYYPSDRYIKEHSKKYILFGCSIEPCDVPRGLGKHLLETFDLITVRESLSYEALKGFGIKNAYLIHDPAFLLEPKDAPEKQNAVGINLSPLVLSNSNKKVIMDNYLNLVKYILDNTNMDIKLIPHVVWAENDDRDPLTSIKEHFETDRITLVRDNNCEVLKGILSSLRFFVGARTHSTIAAYSTCVPTLVTGYSIKAQGIAKDIMGQTEGYVISVKSMSTPDELSKAFVKITAEEASIRQHLTSIMPEYIHQAKDASLLLKQTI